MSFNKITMVGNVGRDPELRRLPDGATVCNFNVAVNEATRDRKSSATWFRITVWGERAGICARKLKKGSAFMSRADLSRDSGKTNKANVT
jgi:single-strand DNA-binding protein